MESKVCVICNTEKNIDIFLNKYRECRPCNIKRSLKRYYENKNISAHQKLYYEKNKDLFLANSKLNQQIKKFERKI